MFPDEAAAWDGPRPLPDQIGWMAVLLIEELRVRRHGGTHGLILVRLDGVADGQVIDQAAASIAGAIRDIDFLARTDLDGFAVLALHCEDLETVVSRLRRALDRAGLGTTSHIEGRSAGADLCAVWEAMLADAPARRGRRHVDFSVSAPPSLN